MIKASALYIVIVIALVIGILCSSLVLMAYFYRCRYEKSYRYEKLSNNLGSGVNILLADVERAYETERSFSLFSSETDSVSLQRIDWGIFDIGIARSFALRDTLVKTFLIGQTIDSAKWASLYLTDEYRPLSVSGMTLIGGNAFIPEAGIRAAYANNEAYRGKRQFISGHQYISKTKLPELDSKRIAYLQELFNLAAEKDAIPEFKADPITVPFSRAVRYLKLGKTPRTLRNIRLSGRIVVLSDTTVTVDSTARLENIIIVARTIVVKNGFQGVCQLFATDSLMIGQRCHFNYPSCAGLVEERPQPKGQALISLGDRTNFFGTLFTWRKAKEPLLSLITFGKGVNMHGQVYAQGVLGYLDTLRISGSLYTTRMRYSSSFAQYENFLINATVDSRSLSRYYLPGMLLPAGRKKSKILRWLD